MTYRRKGIGAVILLVGILGCSAGPPGSCEVTNEGNQYRAHQDVENDQLPGSPQPGRTYSAASGCVPGDRTVNT